MRSSAVGAILAAAVLAGACKGDSKRPTEPDPTVPTAVTTVAPPTTTAAADPFAVPTTIDAPYLERVLAAHNKVYGAAARQVVETHEFDRSTVDDLGAIFDMPLLERQVKLFRDIPSHDRSLYKNPIGNRRMNVQEVLSARKDCVYLRVTIDVSDVVVSPPPPEDSYVTLAPKPAAADPAHMNPTPWVMTDESSKREDPCAG